MTGEPAENAAGSVRTLDRVREVFAGRGFRRYFAARTVSQLGDGIFQLAAADVLLFEDPGTNPSLKLLGLIAVTLVPFSAIGPFAGVFIDRWERRRILITVPLLRALVAAITPLAAMLGTRGVLFYAVVLVVLSANRFFLATMGAVLPQLVPEDDLLVANSVASTGGSIANVTGLLIGAAASAVFGGTRTAAFAALAFFLSALTARRVPAHRGLRPERAPLGAELREVAAQLVEGIRLVRSDRRVVFGFSAIGLVQVLVGTMTAVLFHSFIVILGLEVGSATGLLAVLAVGIGIGVVLVPVVGERVRHDRLVPVAFAIAAGGVLVSAGAITRPRLTVSMLFIGLSYAFAKIPVDTIVQEEIADAVRGRAFAIYDMLFNVARVAGVGVVAIGYRNGARTTSVVAWITVSYVAAAAVFGIWERSLHVRKRPKIDPAGLLLPGEMVSVRAYAGGRADEEPRAIVVGGHELPVEAIDWRAVVEEGGRRARVFVVRVAGMRVRLALREDDTAWWIERVSPLPETE